MKKHITGDQSLLVRAARPPKGKPLTFRPMRLDDDVWAECQRLGKEHGTINEGMAVAHEALKAGGDARIERLEAQLMMKSSAIAGMTTHSAFLTSTTIKPIWKPRTAWLSLSLKKQRSRR